MLSVLRSMLDTLVSIVMFVVHTFTSLFHLISRIPQLLAVVTDSIGFLPNRIMPFATAGITIMIVLFVLNRKVSS